MLCQVKFRAADAGPLRNKSSQCDFCGKTPVEGQRFGTCKQCQQATHVLCAVCERPALISIYPGPNA
ncbi:hypothetical protein DAEQUDRAFT_733494 [Daedalea quercina L-15889]|uniref:Phorbol-ester/DAG-type domain-containing protein n=1 Tax=Daedalea quercina L-15889 TaxID=1314783 RepID=A0A165KXV5_9APHY|nr:hypothetical protein DAEQUDRAFT_733494 [Daedalea quercina L-15889]